MATICPFCQSATVQLLSIPLQSCSAWRDRSSLHSLIPPHLPFPADKKRTNFSLGSFFETFSDVVDISMQPPEEIPSVPRTSPKCFRREGLFSSFSDLTVLCLKNNQLAPLQLRGRNWFPITRSLLRSSGTFFWLDSSCAWGCPGKSNWELSGYGFWIDFRCRRDLAAKPRGNFYDTVSDSWAALRLLSLLHERICAQLTAKCETIHWHEAQWINANPAWQKAK